jgi:hypothetical protein
LESLIYDVYVVHYLHRAGQKSTRAVIDALLAVQPKYLSNPSMPVPHCLTIEGLAQGLFGIRASVISVWPLPFHGLTPWDSC